MGSLGGRVGSRRTNKHTQQIAVVGSRSRPRNSPVVLPSRKILYRLAKTRIADRRSISRAAAGSRSTAGGNMDRLSRSRSPIRCRRLADRDRAGRLCRCGFADRSRRSHQRSAQRKRRTLATCLCRQQRRHLGSQPANKLLCRERSMFRDIGMRSPRIIPLQRIFDLDSSRRLGESAKQLAAAPESRNLTLLLRVPHPLSGRALQMGFSQKQSNLGRVRQSSARRRFPDRYQRSQTSRTRFASKQRALSISDKGDRRHRV